MTERILIVDDSSDDVEWAKKQIQEFEGLDATVENVATLRDALKTLPLGWDAILLDLGLPDSDGLDTAHALLKQTDTPIIIYSVSGANDMVRTALQQGCYDYVIKGNPRSTSVGRAIYYAIHRSQHLRKLSKQQGILQETLAALIGRVARAPSPSEVKLWEQAPVASLLFDEEGTLVRATGEANRIMDAEKLSLKISDMHAVRQRLNKGRSVVHPVRPGSWDVLLFPHQNETPHTVGLLLPHIPLVRAQSGDETIRQAMHHFRTPMTPIMLDLGSLEQMVGSIPQEAISPLQRIRRNTERMRRFSEQFVDALALEDGSINVHKEEFDLAPVLHRCLERHPVAHQHVPGSIPAIGDVNRIEDAVNMMLCHAGPESTLEVRLEDDTLAVDVVSPNWDGPAPETLLVPFQVEMGASDPGGLGLHNAQMMARMIGGDFKVNMQGKDLCFDLVLQKAVPAESSRKEVRHSAHP